MEPQGAGDFMEFLTRAGTQAVMLWWFMYKLDPRMKSLEESHERLFRIVILLYSKVADDKGLLEGILKEIGEGKGK